MNYNQTNLIVVRIDFNTSGNNDTVSLWLNRLLNKRGFLRTSAFHDSVGTFST
jgi:hypothetical protein